MVGPPLWLDSGDSTAADSGAFHCAGLSYVLVVRYLFADCRWALDDPALGRTQYLAGPHPRARCSSTSSATSRPRPGAGGRHPLPARSDFARAAGLAGIGPGHVRRRLRLDGRRRAALVAPAPLRPRRLRRDRPRRLARAARPRARSTPSRPSSSRGRATTTRSSSTSWPARLGELVVVDARLPPASAASRTRRQRPRPDPRRAQRALDRAACRSYPTGELVAYCGSGRHRLRHPAPPAPRRAATGGSTRARGPSGSSTTSSRASERLGRSGAERREVLLPALRDLRRGEPDEEHRRRRPRRMRRAPSAPRAGAGCPCAGCRARRR